MIYMNRNQTWEERSLEEVTWDRRIVCEHNLEVISTTRTGTKRVADILVKACISRQAKILHFSFHIWLIFHSFQRCRIWSWSYCVCYYFVVRLLLPSSNRSLTTSRGCAHLMTAHLHYRTYMAHLALHGIWPGRCLCWLQSLVQPGALARSKTTPFPRRTKLTPSWTRDTTKKADWKRTSNA